MSSVIADESTQLFFQQKTSFLSFPPSLFLTIYYTDVIISPFPFQIIIKKETSSFLSFLPSTFFIIYEYNISCYSCVMANYFTRRFSDRP